MKIKSANYFRQKYHTDIRGFKEGSGYEWTISVAHIL